MKKLFMQHPATSAFLKAACGKMRFRDRRVAHIGDKTSTRI